VTNPDEIYLAFYVDDTYEAEKHLRSVSVPCEEGGGRPLGGLE
jgi:hypothetical protein